MMVENDDDDDDDDGNNYNDASGSREFRVLSGASMCVILKNRIILVMNNSKLTKDALL